MIVAEHTQTAPMETPLPAPSVAMQLRRAIVSRRARIGVVGLGYVGVPLAAAFAEAGFEVLGFDVNAGRAAAINAGQSPIADVPDQTIQALVDDGFFQATVDMDRLADADAISICVPTPLGKTHDPDISYVVAATEQIARTLRRGQLIILESTTYPGTTREVILSRLEATGLRSDEDFFLAFSPERIDPGNSRFGVKNTPKVVGGIGAQATELAQLLYRQAIDSVVSVSSPEAAELVKLLENTFRSVNIALANELALMCNRLDVNVWEVIEAAATKPFGFMPFYPGPGIGGHCIPLDPQYLAWKMKTLNYRARFIELAGEVNAEMPRHVVDKVSNALNDRRQSVKDADILVLGVAYKPGVADARESPALDIIDLLQQRGAKVSYSDPHVPSLVVGSQTLTAEPLTPKALAAADCVVIVTNHLEFDYPSIAMHAGLVVDTRNALAQTPAGAGCVIGL